MNMLIESSAINSIDVSVFAQHPLLIDGKHMERLSPPAFWLDDNGYIQECDKSAERMFGYGQQELAWQHISCLFPSLAEVVLMQGDRLNPMLNYICHCDHVFEAIDRQGNIIICNLNCFLVDNKGKPNVRLMVRPVSNANS
jgi:PAS domain S-box-containing protein